MGAGVHHLVTEISPQVTPAWIWQRLVRREAEQDYLLQRSANMPSFIMLRKHLSDGHARIEDYLLPAQRNLHNLRALRRKLDRLTWECHPNVAKIITRHRLALYFRLTRAIRFLKLQHVSEHSIFAARRKARARVLIPFRQYYGDQQLQPQAWASYSKLYFQANYSDIIDLA